MRRKRFLRLAAAGSGFAIGPARTRAAQFEFKLGTVLEPDRAAVIRLSEMFAAIEQESGGRIHVSIFPNNQLGTESAMFSQLRVGAMQLMLISPGFLASVVPVADITNIGFAFRNEDEALRVMDGPLGGYVRDECATKGLYAFRAIWNAGMYEIGSALRPIVKPDDLRGFKIRVAGKIAVDLFKELGANPAAMNIAEVYTGLQTKLIDGEAAPLTVIETTHFYEVHKYVSMTNHAWSSEWLVANGEIWKGLPADVQAIVERNHAKYVALARSDTKTFNASLVAKLTAHGEAVNAVDQGPFRARLAQYYRTWQSAFGTTAWGHLEASLGRKLT